MTQKEIDDKTYELRMYISDKFRDIQMQSQALKNVEDETKNLQTCVKISDFVAEIQKAYGSLEELAHEEPEEEPQDDFESEFGGCDFGSYI